VASGQVQTKRAGANGGLPPAMKNPPAPFFKGGIKVSLWKGDLGDLKFFTVKTINAGQILTTNHDHYLLMTTSDQRKKLLIWLGTQRYWPWPGVCPPPAPQPVHIQILM